MSKIDRVLLFAFSHQTVIIELIFAIILGIVVMWLFTNIRGESSDVQGSGANIKDIERALKKVLESTDIKVANAQAATLIKDDETGSPSLGAEPRVFSDPIEVARLKAEMENKSKKLSEVEIALAQAKDELAKAKAAGGTSAGTGGAAPAGINTDELQAKIKSLESRLSEYEIIEDDIANLSLYKEENAKLKAEMNKLKGGSGEAATSETPAPSTTMAPSAPIASATPVPQNSDGATPSVVVQPADVSAIDSDKLVKEFDNLVAHENTVPAKGEPTPPPVAASAPAPAPTAPPASPVAESPAALADGGEKLIEEFENFVKGSNT